MSRFILGQNTPDSHQSSPHWLAVVFRYDTANSFSPEKNRNGDTEVSQAVPVSSARPFVISNEIVDWQFSQSKTNYSASLSLTLVPTNSKEQPDDYLQEFNPGDWVVFWAMDDQETFNDVLSNIRDSRPANAFSSGMKFVGCINSVQRVKTVSDGMVSLGYQVQCLSFREFDAKQFYSPYLNSLFKDTIFQEGLMALFTSEIDKKVQNPIGPIQAILSDLLATLMGAAPAVLQDVNFEVGGKERLYFSKGFSLPRGLLKLFKSEPEPEVAYAVDFLQSWIGIQKYNETSVSGGSRSNPNEYQFLIPQLTPLLGVSLFTPANFNNNSAWGILTSYLNQPLNEHYTALKPSPGAGALFPTYIARQLPFTSNAFAEFGRGVESAFTKYLIKEDANEFDQNFNRARLIGNTTPYSSLPRWVVTEDTVLTEALGKSESLRINWVHIPSEYPQVTGEGAQTAAAIAFSRAPPRTNSVDIRRHGIVAYQNRIRFDILDEQLNQIEGGVYLDYWSRFMTDILMGQHLRLTGQITTFGVPEPVQVGDNLEYRGSVYHIESLSHRGGIDPVGNKYFTTQFMLSNGIGVAQSFNGAGSFNSPAEAPSESGITTSETFE